ncbi:MAG: flagellar hook-basal body complex protein FliE [Ignavibacteriales bacterium]|nr:MAG: flagellar hook-basal body complex protein FliE [Ignavibacteriales bacterium]
MNIEGITGGLKLGSLQKTTGGANGLEFGNVFTDFLKQVNEDQATSNQALNDFVSGNGVELHEVMIAGEKAKTSLDLLVEIRNKTIDMYREISRM